MIKKAILRSFIVMLVLCTAVTAIEVKRNYTQELRDGACYIRTNSAKTGWLVNSIIGASFTGTNGMYFDFSTSGVVKVLNANASDGVLSCVTPQGSASFITSIADGTGTFYNHSLHFQGVYYPVKIFNVEQVTGTNYLTFLDNDSDNEGSKFIVGSIGAGVYKIEAEFHSTNVTANATIYGAIFKNNTLVSESTSVVNVATTGTNSLFIICQIPLVSNDRVAIKIAKRGLDGTFFYVCREAKFRVRRISR